MKYVQVFVALALLAVTLVTVSLWITFAGCNTLSGTDAHNAGVKAQLARNKRKMKR
jgi:hypothetical protein